jgi:hypothetical protein
MPEVQAVQVHRMFFHFSELPLSMRTLFTATLIVLGIGYVFAMIQIYETHSGLDGQAGVGLVRTDVGDAAGERKGDDHRMGA